MSQFDYNNGYSQGSTFANARADAASRNADRAIGSWQRYSADLESKLASARKAAACHAATAAGRDAQQKALRDALRLVAPDHPLLEDGRLRNIGGMAMEQKFAEHGYDYDHRSEELKQTR